MDAGEFAPEHLMPEPRPPLDLIAVERGEPASADLALHDLEAYTLDLGHGVMAARAQKSG